MKKMKNKIKALLQKIVGYERYLFIFAIFKVYTLRWDKHEKTFIHFLEHIKEDDNVLDIGANIGVMTVLLAKKSSKGKIFAFEPMPNNFNVLKRVVQFFNLKNVELFDCALGDSDTVVEMATPIIDSSIGQGGSHVLHNSIDEYESYTHKTEVSVKKLDTMSEFERMKINALKIDVENFENFVFKGATNILKANDILICCELWQNENRDKSFEILKSTGYTPTILNSNSVLEDFNASKHTTINFIFKKK
jgi:FkbM family methyltransferase